MKKLLAVIALTALWVLRAFGKEADVPQALELEDAVRLVLERNPQLRAANIGVQAADGRLLQAGSIPNPILAAEVEDFGGSGDKRGFDSGQTTLGLEQTVELGGKRTARRNVAAAEMKLAEWTRDAAILILATPAPEEQAKA